MTTLLVILWVILTVMFIGLLAIKVQRTKKSRFELKRLGDEVTLRREKLLGIIIATRRALVILLFGFISIVSLAIFGAWSLIITPFLLVIAILLARLSFIVTNVNKHYDLYEYRILNLVEKNPWLGVFMLPLDRVPLDQKLESTEHLLYLVNTSHFLSDDQLTIIRNGLTWPNTNVGQIMVPRKKIVSLKKSELLGPLVLNDLHMTGHSQFPVTDGSIDAIVGILDITESLEVSSMKKSKQVGDDMSTQVVRVAESDTLPTALELLQKSKQHMLIVVGKDGETLGLVTIADITTSLLGKTGVE